jgi:hypothetical protein
MEALLTRQMDSHFLLNSQSRRKTFRGGETGLGNPARRALGRL